jgi:single-strand DNA-binding protein
MSANLNMVQLIGHLGMSPETRVVSTGTTVGKFTIATNREWKTQAGEKMTATDWHNIEVWGKLAENCKQYLAKGRQVYVQGRLQTDSYADPNDPSKTKYFTKIVAEKVSFLGAPTVNGGPEGPVDDQGTGYVGEDEIPF